MEDNVTNPNDSVTWTDVELRTPSKENLQDCYVKQDEFAEVKADVKDIKDNHLPHILREVANLRWFIIASAGVLAIVLTILQVLG